MLRSKQGLPRPDGSRLAITSLSCRCEADDVSRSNLMEGCEIAAHLSGVRNDKGSEG